MLCPPQQPLGSKKDFLRSADGNSMANFPWSLAPPPLFPLINPESAKEERQWEVDLRKEYKKPRNTQATEGVGGRGPDATAGGQALGVCVLFSLFYSIFGWVIACFITSQKWALPAQCHEVSGVTLGLRSIRAGAGAHNICAGRSASHMESPLPSPLCFKASWLQSRQMGFRLESGDQDGGMRMSPEGQSHLWVVAGGGWLSPNGSARPSPTLGCGPPTPLTHQGLSSPHHMGTHH